MLIFDMDENAQKKQIKLLPEKASSQQGKPKVEKDFFQDMHSKKNEPSGSFFKYHLSQKEYPAFLLFFILILVSAVLLGFWYLNENSRPFEMSLRSSVTPKPSENPDNESSPSAQMPEKEDKSQIKIKVLNGSGISGLASKTAQVITKLGFSQVSSGNAETDDNEDTLLEYGQKISKQTVKEISLELAKSFKSVKPKQSKDLEDNSITIITGQIQSK